MMSAKPIYETHLGKRLWPTCADTRSPSMMDLHDDDLSSTDVDSPELVGNVSQETSATKASFSSLIDYNPQGSSQASQRASSSPPGLLESFSEPSIKSQAETLRLRLRVALYKVRTNQTNIPLSELALPAESPEPELPTLASTSRPPVPSITISSTSPAATRTAPTTTTTAVPKLLPAPILRPTAYSSRHITEPYLPSSPPASASPESTDTTPLATPIAQTRPIEQLSSPPESEERGASCAQQRRRGELLVDDDADLASSVVTGRAASGLLELMRAG
ncbi:hypothetical protein AOQ84DRAFT_353638 [Glonium stellatum]|uniref:Uncharacterized protein n=1 Tax=Glonium stellatum TaxID=574774 RepID=A0A8E2F482_9PEZI|nr:hypothetical protein AOQ84DRAFT_353638 [Glonium stellatum]